MNGSGHAGGGSAPQGGQPRAVWAQLEELAAEEARLVADGHVDDLAAVHARRDALLAALPHPLPREAVEPLRRALTAMQATAAALAALREGVAAELARLQRGRHGVQGYARAYDVQP
jgi:hypothetical protein